MKQNNKVVLDFTQTINPIDIAIMPASVAKRALQALAEQCNSVTPNYIMQEQIGTLQNLYDNSKYVEFIQANADFVQERELMDNISAKNWDVYKVEQPKADNEL